MSFQSPSDRFRMWLRKFFLLEPLSSRRIIRVIWEMAFIMYGLQIFAWIFTFPTQVWSVGSWSSSATFLLFAPLTPLMWLLIIRLVLEVADRVLQSLPSTPPGQDTAIGN